MRQVGEPSDLMRDGVRGAEQRVGERKPRLQGRPGENLARADLDLAAANALGDAYIVTNPREVSEADARAICQRAW